MDQVAVRETTPGNIHELSEEQLDVLEREIAKKYMQIVPWGAVAWGLGNCLVDNLSNLSR